MKIALIGVSESKNYKFSRELFFKIVNYIEFFVLMNNFSWNEIEFWSRGCAGVDHVAVFLTLKYRCNLKIFILCDFVNNAFVDNSSRKSEILNRAHRNFSIEIEMNTLNQLNLVIHDKEKIGLQHKDVSGILFEDSVNRTKQFCKADILICIGFGTEPRGSCEEIWNNYHSKNKFYINLLNIDEYLG